MLFTYKPPGCLNTTIANEKKNELNKKKVCICGKLDPMARGELLLLFDEECKNMNLFINKRKVYQWQILWGLKTDTEDTLGVLLENKKIELDLNLVNNSIKKYIGTYKQNYHHYSSIHVKNKNNERKALWEWSLLKRLNEVIIPNKVVNVSYIKLLKTEIKCFNSLKKNIIDNISNIKGNFRQNQIIEQWKSFSNDNFYISTFEADVSSGFYIRELIKQIGKDTNYLGIALDINRTKIII